MKTVTHSTDPFPSYGNGDGNERIEDRSLHSPTTRPLSGDASASDQVGEQSTLSDAYLVAQCLNGREEAWEALIQKYKRLIYSVPIKYGASSADAADILQSVYMELFSELSKLRKAESLKSWLMVVTSRKCFQWHRQRRLELTLDNLEEDYPEAIAVPSPQIMEAEREQCMREGIAQLSPRCRELVRLLFYEDPPLPYVEVAQRLGLATGSIGFTRARCLDRLHKVLRQTGF